MPGQVSAKKSLVVVPSDARGAHGHLPSDSGLGVPCVTGEAEGQTVGQDVHKHPPRPPGQCPLGLRAVSGTPWSSFC